MLAMSSSSRSSNGPEPIPVFLKLPFLLDVLNVVLVSFTRLNFPGSNFVDEGAVKVPGEEKVRVVGPEFRENPFVCPFVCCIEREKI